ncbi:unnamed protein product [Ectocarpus sp. CCAP 1310/34]|nr:unnamed protein product [Ectocarpus sp. CCAP 1310/34]
MSGERVAERYPAQAGQAVEYDMQQQPGGSSRGNILAGDSFAEGAELQPLATRPQPSLPGFVGGQAGSKRTAVNSLACSAPTRRVQRRFEPGGSENVRPSHGRERQMVAAEKSVAPSSRSGNTLAPTTSGLTTGSCDGLSEDEGLLEDGTAAGDGARDDTTNGGVAHNEAELTGPQLADLMEYEMEHGTEAATKLQQQIQQQGQYNRKWKAIYPRRLLAAMKGGFLYKTTAQGYKKANAIAREALLEFEGLDDSEKTEFGGQVTTKLPTVTTFKNFLSGTKQAFVKWQRSASKANDNDTNNFWRAVRETMEGIRALDASTVGDSDAAKQGAIDVGKKEKASKMAVRKIRQNAVGDVNEIAGKLKDALDTHGKAKPDFAAFMDSSAARAKDQAELQAAETRRVVQRQEKMDERQEKMDQVRERNDVALKDFRRKSLEQGAKIAKAIQNSTSEYPPLEDGEPIPWTTFGDFWADVRPTVQAEAEREAISELYDDDIRSLVFDARDKKFNRDLFETGSGNFSANTAKFVMKTIHKHVYLKRMS